MTTESELLKTIELCFLPKLSKNAEESETHVEYIIRKRNLNLHFPSVIKLLENIKNKKNFRRPKVLSTLLILYRELASDGPWKTDQIEMYSKKLNSQFELLYEYTCNDVLTKSVNAQHIFDNCMDTLHKKLTTENFKKYPGQIEVYCSLIQSIKEYKISVNPLKVLPASLLLIEDYMSTNKVKGLKSCSQILQCLSPKEFEDGNYYDVIYEVLKKPIYEKDLQITKLVLNCLLLILNVIPMTDKTKKTDDLFCLALDQLYTESNLHRKSTILNFSKSLIQINGINCIKRKKKFHIILFDNLDVCTNETVADILLYEVLECLQVWIQYSWCVWEYSVDHKIVSTLLKILYTCQNKESLTHVQNIIITLIGLCTKEEKQKIITNLERSSPLFSQDFVNRINEIIIGVKTN